MGRKRYLYTLCLPHVTSEEPIRLGRRKLYPGGKKRLSRDEREAQSMLLERVIPELNCYTINAGPLIAHFATDCEYQGVLQAHRAPLAMLRLSLLVDGIDGEFADTEFILLKHCLPMTKHSLRESFLNGSPMQGHSYAREQPRPVVRSSKTALSGSSLEMLRSLRRKSKNRQHEIMVAAEAFVSSKRPKRYNDSVTAFIHTIRGIDVLLRGSRDADDFGAKLAKQASPAEEWLRIEGLACIPARIEEWGTVAYRLRSALMHSERTKTKPQRPIGPEDMVWQPTGSRFVTFGHTILRYLLMSELAPSPLEMLSGYDFDYWLGPTDSDCKDIVSKIDSCHIPMSEEVVLLLKRVPHCGQRMNLKMWKKILSKVLQQLDHVQQRDAFDIGRMNFEDHRSCSRDLRAAASAAETLQHELSEEADHDPSTLRMWNIVHCCELFLFQAQQVIPRLLPINS